MTTGCVRISGGFDPDETTRLLNIEPTWIARTGECSPDQTGIPRVSSIWCLSAKEESAGDVADQLIERMVPPRESAQSVAKPFSTYSGMMELISFRDISQEDWFLSADVLRDLASLHVPVRRWMQSIAQHQAEKEWLGAN